MNNALTNLVPRLDPNSHIIMITSGYDSRATTVTRSTKTRIVRQFGAALHNGNCTLSCNLARLRTSPPSVIILVSTSYTIARNDLTRLTDCTRHCGHPIRTGCLVNRPARNDLGDSVSTFTVGIGGFIHPLKLGRLKTPYLLAKAKVTLP